MLGTRLNQCLAFMIVVLVLVLACIGNASAQLVTEFYRGKQLRFITGYSAGGSFDNVRDFLPNTLVSLSPETRMYGSRI